MGSQSVVMSSLSLIFVAISQLAQFMQPAVPERFSNLDLELQIPQTNRPRTTLRWCLAAPLQISLAHRVCIVLRKNFVPRKQMLVEQISRR